MTPALVLHHDDPPCTARLDEDGTCPACGFVPDTQSTCLRYYCPACDCLLRNLACPQCGQTFSRPAD